MNSFNSLLTKAKVFLSTYKWLLIPIVPIIIFIYIIIYIFYAQNNQTAPVSTQQLTQQASQAPEQTTVPSQPVISPSPNEQPALSPEQAIETALDEETSTIASGNLKLAQEDSDDSEDGSYPGDDEVDEGSSKVETLPDGSMEYQYPSADPNRQHMQIIENNAVIFRRNIMSGTGYTVSDYSDLLNTPEYTSQGSAIYGGYAEILASPTKGIAIVIDSQTGDVYEQDLFEAMSVNDYLKKFGSDISTFNPEP